MLAKSPTPIPDGDGWLLRAEVGRLPLHRVPRRRRDRARPAATSARSPATSPSCSSRSLRALPERCVVDGEIVVPATDDRGLDFDALLQRIHPAESRVRRLAAETPASFVAFDLLALDDDVAARPSRCAERRGAARAALAAPTPPIHLTPAHHRPRRRPTTGSTAFEGAGLDGVIAKRARRPYTPDKRTLVKVKHQRTADCVGRRLPHPQGRQRRRLAAARPVRRRRAAAPRRRRRVVHASSGAAELLAELEPLTHDALDDHPWREWAEWHGAPPSGQRMPGGGSRWNAGKDLSWVPLRIELVAEVAFGQLQERPVPPRRRRSCAGDPTATPSLHLRPARRRRAGAVRRVSGRRGPRRSWPASAAVGVGDDRRRRRAVGRQHVLSEPMSVPSPSTVHGPRAGEPSQREPVALRRARRLPVSGRAGPER